MTRKDYRLIAECIKEQLNLRGNVESIQKAEMRMLVSSLCIRLHEDNPRFKAEVFVKACGF